jgi:hypothetical protein
MVNKNVNKKNPIFDVLYKTAHFLISSSTHLVSLLLIRIGEFHGVLYYITVQQCYEMLIVKTCSNKHNHDMFNMSSK